MTPPKTKRKPTRRAIAENLSKSLNEHVSPDQVRRWEAKGFDLDNPDVLRKQLATQQRGPFRSPELRALEIRKLLAQCVKLERENAELKRSYTHKSQIVRQNEEVARTTRKALDHVLVASREWHTMDAAQIEASATAALDQVAKVLNNPQSYK